MQNKDLLLRQLRASGYKILLPIYGARDAVFGPDGTLSPIREMHQAEVDFLDSVVHVSTTTLSFDAIRVIAMAIIAYEEVT